MSQLDVTMRGGVLTVKGCLPHYRRPIAEIVELRERIYKRLADAHIPLPIKNQSVHLRVAAKRHTDGGDLSNVLQAVCQALDGNTLDKSKAILVDDKQVTFISARWIP